MAQQPNVELTSAKLPRPTPEPAAAQSWRSGKPGIPMGPADVVRGGAFGDAGPDAGWGLKLVNGAELPDDDPRLRDVVVGLVLARAAAYGRAPIPLDIDVALALCGYDEDAPGELRARRKRWMEATAHDQRPGQTAVAEVDGELILYNPEQIRYAQRTTERS